MLWILLLSLPFSNNTFYGISAFFKHNFCLAPRWKMTWPQWIYFFYISPLKSLNLALIPGTKLDGHRGTWRECYYCYKMHHHRLVTNCLLCRRISDKPNKKLSWITHHKGLYLHKWHSRIHFLEVFEKWRAIRASMGGVGVMLAWVTR